MWLIRSKEMLSNVWLIRLLTVSYSILSIVLPVRENNGNNDNGMVQYKFISFFSFIRIIVSSKLKAKRRFPPSSSFIAPHNTAVISYDRSIMSIILSIPAIRLNISPILLNT